MTAIVSCCAIALAGFSEGNNSSGYFTAGTSPLLDLKQPVLAELPLNYKPDSSIEAEISFWYSDISQTDCCVAVAK